MVLQGVYIGDTFFPVTSAKEESSHEMYLRSASAGKPTTLKLHANVTGKFTVERDLEHVQSKLRETTINTTKQNTRNIIMIDTPPDLTPATNSRKRTQNPASSMFRSTARPGEGSKPNPSSSTHPPPPARVSSPMPPRAINDEKSTPLRKRLVHFLALCERTQEQIVRMVGGADCSSSMRREILALVNEVGLFTRSLNFVLRYHFLAGGESNCS